MKCAYCGVDYIGLHLVNGFYMCWKCSADEIIEHGWSEKEENKK